MSHDNHNSEDIVFKIASILKEHCSNLKDLEELILKIGNSMGVDISSTADIDNRFNILKKNLSAEYQIKIDQMLEMIALELISHKEYADTRKIRMVDVTESLNHMFCNIMLKKISVDCSNITEFDSNIMDCIDVIETDDPSLFGTIAEFHDDGYWIFGKRESVVCKLPVSIYTGFMPEE